MLGPNFCYQDYILFIEKRERYANIPSAWRLTLQHFLLAIVSLVLAEVIAPDYFNINYLRSEEFGNHNIFIQYLYIMWIGRLYEHKFMFGF